MSYIPDSRINFKKLIDNFQKPNGIKSVVTPSAQSSSPCALGSVNALPGFDYATDVLHNDRLPVVIKAVVELQYRYGLRISEVLQIGQFEVAASGRILIRSKKGSDDRIVLPVDYMHFWTHEAYNLLPLISRFSRFYFYREYRKLGWFSHFGSSQVNSVTHYFRHLHGLTVTQEFNDVGITQRELGHKSINSTHYYVKKQR